MPADSAEDACAHPHHDHDHHNHDHGHAHRHDHDHGHGAHGHDPHGHSHGHHDHDHHDHGHGFGGRHHHAPPVGAARDPRFLIGIVLNLGFVGVEAVAGIFGRSTALLADAGHNLGDVLGLGLAAGAAWMAGRPAAGRRTYGFAKATILATLINSLVLVFACGAIALEAVRRFAEPASPDSPIIIATALGGVVVNGVTALLFLRGRNADLNIRAAFLHMAQDAVVSLGVAASAALIWFTHWSILDPLVSLAILALILWSSVDLLSEAVNLSLDAAPRQHKVEEIRAFLAAQPGVSEVHDLHVWSLSTTDTALTAHLVRPHDDSDSDGFLHAACAGLQQRFGIAHATLQIESQALSACAELHD